MSAQSGIGCVGSVRTGTVDLMYAGQRRPVGLTPRRDCGLSSYERVLGRAGLAPVAGVDEAGRGACAGPLVVAAVVLKPTRIASLTELDDSKALTEKARNMAYDQVMRAALDWSVVIIPSTDIDRLGLHVCNVAGMRRALAALGNKPGFVLTDGFPVRGLTAPNLAMWKGDQVAACVAAASVVAKVTRDAIMCKLDAEFPGFGFARHKGYSTRSHMNALAEHGPCPEHRRSFVNVRGHTVVVTDEPLLKSEAANSCDPASSGQNGPIVDAIEEYGWPTAGSAAMARGA